MPQKSNNQLVVTGHLTRVQNPGELSTLDVLGMIPEEQVWLAGLKSAGTRKGYQRDVTHFARVLNIQSSEQLYGADHRAVTFWEQHMRETEGLEPATIRRRLSALSSLFTHLVKHDVADINPVREIKRPELDRSEGKTPAFGKQQARKILDAPDPDTLLGKRDRAILSVGFQVGFRRAEICTLSVDALHQNKGFDALWVKRKRRRNRQSITINPTIAQRIKAYLEASGHGDDRRGPMFRPVRNNGRSGTDILRRHLEPKAITRILQKYARQVLGRKNGDDCSAHWMRATFATTALENECGLEEVQHALGHADVSTTRLYDRRRHNPEKAASYFANY